MFKSCCFLKLFLLLILSASCSEEDWNMDIDDGHEYITFTVSAPYNSVPTYAMTEKSENTIETIDVLAFRVEAGEELYSYRASGKEIKDGANNSQKEFTVSLKKDDDIYYRFVIIANAAKELDELPQAQSATKNQLLARLLSKNSTQWNATSASDFSPIPMWGETKDLKKITEGVKKITDITLLRSLVALDVVVTSSAQSDFVLKEVYLYNRKTRGRIVPIASHFDANVLKVTAASMPLDTPSDPLTIWAGLKYTSISGTELKKTIYTYEAPAVGVNDALEATCLVIGGLYKSSMAYYRLDFFEKDLKGDFLGYLDLLRNHKYTLNITTVTDEGYETPDEAFFGKKLGMTAEVEAWNMSDMAEVVVDEEYFLRISKGLFDLNSLIFYGAVTIQTDHPKGWQVSTNNSWITITNKTASSFNFIVNQNSTGSTRVGEILIKAGNLTNKIKINQN